MVMKAEGLKRKGIVWLSSYPRSGNTWVRNFLYSLLSLRGGAGETANINKLHEYSVWDIAAPRFEKVLGKKIATASRSEIAAARPKVQKRMVTEANGPILVKTHNALVLDRGVPTINMAVTSGAVYIVRNPLDVAISFAHHFGVDFDEAIRRMNRRGVETDVAETVAYEVYGSWSENVMSWTYKAHPAIYVMRYEDMLGSPLEIFKGLATHLLIEASDSDIEQALDLSSFETAKQQEKAAGYRERPMQSPAFFREGRAEQWREALSPDQVTSIVAAHREQMARFGYVPAGF
jgi:hypothetical protein